MKRPDRKYRNVHKLSYLAAALGLCMMSSHAFAQSATGSVFGKTDAEASVTIDNLDTGTSRSIKADASGRYTANQLPTGRYRITVAGHSRDVVVSVGTGSEVNFEKGDLDTIEVVANSSFNPIDTRSVESTTVFTQAQIQQLPVPRDITNVALLAPGTVKGDTGFGNVASFGGSSPAENGYYVNGFDVTNIFNFLSYANLPFDAIAEQQVKTGGYGAEYGRSLGGVISIVTKRGSNDWKGGASLYWAPQGLREQNANVVTRDPDDRADGHVYSVYRADNQSSTMNYNAYIGGPIVKDRLFLFGLVEGRHNTFDTFGDNSSQHDVNNTPRGMVKVDWNITDKHLFEFTGITNRSKIKSTTYDNPGSLLYTGVHGIKNVDYNTTSGGETYIYKYTGYLTDDFTVSAMYGRLNIVAGDRDPRLLGTENCVRAYDSRANAGQVVKIGCWNESISFVRDATAAKDEDKREAWRIDGEWRLGSHDLRFGFDHEDFSSQRAGQFYTGGVYYRYFRRPTAFTVNGVLLPANTDYVRVWDYRSLSGKFDVTNEAAYLEDSWQLTDSWLLYGGLRVESFKNRNAAGKVFAESGNKLAPRIGFSWDVKGDSTFKVFGNAGRYYIPIAGNTSVRLSGGDYTQQNFYRYSGNIDPVTGAPVGGLGTIIGPQDTGGPVAGDPRALAARNLSPMYQDEFILGMQKDFGNHWTGGIRGIYRVVRDGMDDYCSHQPFQDWADDNGYTNFDPSTLPACMLINPGRDLSIAVDVNNDGNLQNVTIPARYLRLPHYRRKYQALELFFEKSSSDKWYLQGSYTLARSVGNVEGYVNSTLEQSDAGITQDFDNALFEDGAYGPLPNDRRHTFKLFGSYKVNDEWRIGANALLQSGRPRNCNGYIPTGGLGIDTQFQGYAASSFYCPDGNGGTKLTHRGSEGRTPWIYNLDMSVEYTPHWAKNLSFGAQVFNVFNIQRVTEYDETSQIGGNASQENNPNYGNIVNYQPARYVQFVG